MDQDIVQVMFKYVDELVATSNPRTRREIGDLLKTLIAGEHALVVSGERSIAAQMAIIAQLEKWCLMHGVELPVQTTAAGATKH